LDKVSTDSNKIAETVTEIAKAIMSSMLPGEEPFTRTDPTTNTAQVFKRVSPAQLLASPTTSASGQGRRLQTEGSQGAVKLPSNLFDNVTLQTTPSSDAVIDVQLSTFTPSDFDGKIGNKNFVTDFELFESGAFGSSGQLQTYPTSSKVAVNGLEGDGVIIDVEVKYLNTAVTFGCYFETG
jgi:hypothetical protein